MQTQQRLNPLKQILSFGQSIWYDGLLPPKEFERLIREDGIRGATTNPTIFEKAIASGEYDEEIGQFSEATEEEIVRTFAIEAVQKVADTFLPVFEETRGEDGYVSIEVNPLLATNTVGTIEEAKEIHSRVNRRNVMIKIPATIEGLPAIKAVIADGLSVNATLIFSVERYRAVMNAYLTGLEERLDTGRKVDHIASVASFFVSRLDTALDPVLVQKQKSLAGEVAIANSKAAYLEFEKTFLGERFQRLKALGAQVQRPLWASTGTKNANYSDVLYVERLMGPQTVNTAPPATLDAFRDHGVPGARLKENIQDSLKILASLQTLGIDLNETTQKLEEAGVASFADSHNKIIQAIRAKRK
ncbi:MAG: transaldolase [Omnitrophica bacterium RIFCSPHIGHO2_02_FULL_51_18]|nr:MAG: transaldolase [Omnitrophica bacterium RIFCSPHIGHO2_02_FULL_51_18]